MELPRWNSGRRCITEPARAGTVAGIVKFTRILQRLNNNQGFGCYFGGAELSNGWCHHQLDCVPAGRDHDSGFGICLDLGSFIRNFA